MEFISLSRGRIKKSDARKTFIKPCRRWVKWEERRGNDFYCLLIRIYCIESPPVAFLNWYWAHCIYIDGGERKWLLFSYRDKRKVFLFNVIFHPLSRVIGKYHKTIKVFTNIEEIWKPWHWMERCSNTSWSFDFTLIWKSKVNSLSASGD